MMILIGWKLVFLSQSFSSLHNVLKTYMYLGLVSCFAEILVFSVILCLQSVVNLW